MTFYWWSHWFWITLVLIVGLLCRHVHTYPSQDGESLASSTQPVRTTKLYQTTVSQTWATATQSNIMDLTHRPTTNRPVTPSVTQAQELSELGDVTMSQYDDEEEEEAAEEDRMLLNYQEQGPEQNQKPDTEADPDTDPDPDVDAEEAAINEKLAQFEFKRSADFTSEQLNNFTNFSSSTSTNGSISNTTKPVPISSINPPAPRATTTKTVPAVATSTTTAASRTSPPAKSGTAAPAPAAAAAAATPSTSTPLGSAAATPSTPKINTEWLSDELLAGASAGLADGEKAPFTLENANKEDELRRAESEHRSRKSKVLSAEYKHINRYINFSSDTKSLLTRSASAAPSVSGDGAGLYDATAAAGDEGNISSEALAIQRTYFLDAGAISAICFTVFGVCCTVGTIGIVLYRRRYVNKPQALSEPDSSVYIDDSTMRDNSDEMYSLDNDSFLNSLEAMTIQNYWTDTVKHTKL
ncbi:mucin-5AC isoform X2 [Drosophila serrata]|uniref:mucin-5AC isoform X2 n=1 Tax=Drosophila serrata TaxID=7274 RepID=UPI000A1D1949|nr:mucin-5AC isoform X2 [Drosophila serrata]